MVWWTWATRRIRKSLVTASTTLLSLWYFVFRLLLPSVVVNDYRMAFETQRPPGNPFAFPVLPLFGFKNIQTHNIWARVKRRYERLQLRSVITTQNMWFTVCSDRGPYVAIPLFRLCLWLKLPVGRMTFQSFDVRVRHWSSRSGLVFLGSCKMACRQVYMR